MKFGTYIDITNNTIITSWNSDSDANRNGIWAEDQDGVNNDPVTGKDESVSHITISGNTVKTTNNPLLLSDNGVGIIVQDCHDCVISENLLSNNKRGFYLHSISYNNFSGNTIIDNSIEGIHLFQSKNNKISQNIFQDNYKGISIRSSSLTTISNNLITNSSDIGIHLDYSLITVVKYNNFLSNKKGAEFRRYSFIKDHWIRNYWDTWKGSGPMVIRGYRMILIGWSHWGPIYFPLPWFALDCYPAKDPYYI